MASTSEAQLALALVQPAAAFDDRAATTCARVDPNHSAYAGAVDSSGLLHYLFLGEGGRAVVAASFELLTCQSSGAEGEDWQPVRSPWLGFSFLPRSPDREVLLCRANSNKLLYVRLPLLEGRREAVYHFGSHSGSLSCFEVRSDGEQVATGCEQGAVKLWSMVTGQQVGGREGAHRGGVTVIAFLGSKKLVSSGRDGTLLLWDTNSGRLNMTHSLSVACSSAVTALQTFDGLRSLQSGPALLPWRRQPPPLPCCGGRIVSADEPPTVIAAGTENGGLYAWMCMADPCLEGGGSFMTQVCVDHTSRGVPIRTLAFSIDGSVLAVGVAGPRHAPQQMLPNLNDLSEGLARVYDTTGWRCRETVRVPRGAPLNLEFVAAEDYPAGATIGPIPRLIFVAPTRGPPLVLPSRFSARGGEADMDVDFGLPANDPLRIASLLSSRPPGEAIAGVPGSEGNDGEDDEGRPRAGRPVGPWSARGVQGEEVEEPRLGVAPQPRTIASLPAPMPTAYLNFSVIPEGEPMEEGTPQRRTDADTGYPALERDPASVRVSGAMPPYHQQDAEAAASSADALPATRVVRAGRTVVTQKVASGGDYFLLEDRPFQRESTLVPPTAYALSAGAGKASKRPPMAPAMMKQPKALPSGVRFVEPTTSSMARQQPATTAAERRLILSEPPATESLPPSGADTVELNSTRLLVHKMNRLAAEKFPTEAEMPAVQAAAAAEAARHACTNCTETTGGYSGLPGVSDTVETSNPRLVPKQLDARWVASRNLKPCVETLWNIEDHLAGVCDTHASPPYFELSRTDVAASIISSALYL